MSCVDPLDWFPEECYWSGLDEAPSGTRDYYRGALRDINPLNAELNPICHLRALLGAHHIFHVSRLRVNGDSPFTQPPLKIFEA